MRNLRVEGDAVMNKANPANIEVARPHHKWARLAGLSRRVLLLLGLVLTVGAIAARAQCIATSGNNVINWTGTSGNWGTTANWDLKCTPNNGTPTGAFYNVILNGTGSDIITDDISPTI